jgi:hypothetical protein
MLEKAHPGKWRRSRQMIRFFMLLLYLFFSVFPLSPKSNPEGNGD